MRQRGRKQGGGQALSELELELFLSSLASLPGPCFVVLLPVSYNLEKPISCGG